LPDGARDRWEHRARRAEIEVQMRAGAVAGVSRTRDHVAPTDTRPSRDERLRQVEVTRHESRRMTERDPDPGIAARRRLHVDDVAIGDSANPSAHRNRDIEGVVCAVLARRGPSARHDRANIVWDRSAEVERDRWGSRRSERVDRARPVGLSYAAGA
jgi:hypothetical protein